MANPENDRMPFQNKTYENRSFRRQSILSNPPLAAVTWKTLGIAGTEPIQMKEIERIAFN
jgi:hypothetical protein